MKSEKQEKDFFKISPKDKPSESFKIPESGSLPLFALGYKGVMLWRAKKKAMMASNSLKDNQDLTHE